MAYILFQKSPHGWVAVAELPEQAENAEGNYVCLEAGAYSFSDFDPRSLTLNSDLDTIVERFPGKSRDEINGLLQQEQLRVEINEIIRQKKITIKRQVWEVLELMEWKFERAEERDALAGTTTETAKVAAYRKAARDKNNEVEAAFDALVATTPSMSEVQAFNESWKEDFVANTPINF